MSVRSGIREAYVSDHLELSFGLTSSSWHIILQIGKVERYKKLIDLVLPYCYLDCSLLLLIIGMPHTPYDSQYLRKWLPQESFSLVK